MHTWTAEGSIDMIVLKLQCTYIKVQECEWLRQSVGWEIESAKEREWRLGESGLEYGDYLYTSDRLVCFEPAVKTSPVFLVDSGPTTGQR